MLNERQKRTEKKKRRRKKRRNGRKKIILFVFEILLLLIVLLLVWAYNKTLGQVKYEDALTNSEARNRGKEERSDEMDEGTAERH